MGKKKSSAAAATAWKSKENAPTKKLSQPKLNELNEAADHLLKLCFDATANPTELWTQYNDIQTVLQRIKAIESELKPKTAPATGGQKRLAAIEQFCQWARTNGIQFDGVQIQQYPNLEFGLQSKRDFKHGELFVTVPRKVILSLDNNLSSVAAALLSQLPVLDTMPNVKLAMALIVERLLGAKSFWKPYIDLLPDKYATVMHFSPAEMAELKGTSAFMPALNQCKHIARQYAFLRKALHSFKENTACDSILAVLQERFTYDIYSWAVSTVMTRQNAIPLADATKDDATTSPSNAVADESQTPALIPFWDLANHIDGHVTTSYNDTNHQIEATTLADVRKGEQIFIHYGNRNNANLLVHNGFVINNNLSDSVSIRLGLSQSDPLVGKRTQLLESIGVFKENDLSVLPPPRFISPELLGFVRVFNMDEEQLTHWLAPDKCATDLLHLDCALNTESETKTWIFMKTRITLLLRAFGTSLEDDEHLLEMHQKKGQQKLGHFKLLIVQFRLNEKRILRNALTYVNERIKP